MKISSHLSVNCETFLNSQIYSIPNFFADPDYIVDFLQSNEPSIWKGNETPSHNTKYFLDRRHYIKDTLVGSTLKDFVHGDIDKQDFVSTNFTKFYKNDFNDFANNYWYPHYDQGFTAIIYLNKGYDGSGTNLYEQVAELTEIEKTTPEHFRPWRSKSKYKLLKTFVATYNTCVIFDAKKFLHGMAIDDDYFFSTERMNLVKFFDRNKGV